jgi:hypothetical protein
MPSSPLSNRRLSPRRLGRGRQIKCEWRGASTTEGRHPASRGGDPGGPLPQPRWILYRSQLEKTAGATRREEDLRPRCKPGPSSPVRDALQLCSVESRRHAMDSKSPATNRAPLEPNAVDVRQPARFEEPRGTRGHQGAPTRATLLGGVLRVGARAGFPDR